MKRRIFAVVLIGVVIGMSGCGSDGDAYVDPDTQHEVEDDFDSTDEEDIDDDAGFEDEVEPEEDEEATVNPEEIEGIVAMVHQTVPSTASSDVQIFSIDPQTGVQKIIAEWRLENPASKNTDTPKFYLPDKSRVYGNSRDWLSSDLTKLSITAVLDNNERHAGWVDYEGNFFDVTSSVGGVKESSFSNPGPVIQGALGFDGEELVFYEEFLGDADATKYYYVPIDNVSEGAVREAGEDDWYYNEAITSTVGNNFYPTSWIDETTCIADVYDHVGRPRSVYVNTVTKEKTGYLPDAERYNWSGILSPDGSTIAFLSVSKASDGIVELYKMPISGGEPTKLTLEPNEDILQDTTALTQDDLYGPAALRDYEQYHFYLLEWK